MASSKCALFLISVLCVAWTCVQAEKTIEILKAEADIIDSEIVGKWNHDVKGNEADVELEILADCLASPISMDLTVTKDGATYFQTAKQFRHPLYEVDGMNMCGGFEPMPDDEDDCAIPKGVHAISGCSPKSVCENFDEGMYDVAVALMQDNKKVLDLTYSIEVKE